MLFVGMVAGGYDGEGFCEFLSELVTHMNPYPGPKSVIILDNCAIHHVPDVDAIAEEA